MLLQGNVQLQSLNTFGVAAIARQFVVLQSANQLPEIFDYLKQNNLQHLVISGGSNLLLTQDFDGLVIKNEIKGFEIIEENDTACFVKVGAGENWHEFVLWCLDRNLGGAENLSLIPGSVGAAPMQNIGAYGVEMKSIFHSLNAFLIETNQIKTFSTEECAFGYRESVFKKSLKNKAVICDVTFKLNKVHQLNTSYGAISEELEKMGVSQPSIRDVSNAVIHIRQSKLPDPRFIGNAGSFFKNPLIDKVQFEALKHKYPNIVGYPSEDGVKVAAGWMIEQLGWKGKTFKNTYGVHKKQALVLVNYDNASGNEIYALSEQILQDVKKHFGITLEREVNII